MRSITRHLQRIVRWSALLIGLPLLLLIAGTQLLNTQTGRDLLVRQLANIAPASGLRVRAERITGSIYGEMEIEGLTLYDRRGAFLTAPHLTIDWRPRPLLAERRIAISRLAADRATVLRRPELNATGAAWPDIRLDLSEVDIRRLELARGVAGQAHVLSLSGRAESAANRLEVHLSARSPTSGDLVRLDLDARPDDDRFSLAARVEAPADGVIAGFAGLPNAVRARIGGEGTWSRWQGDLVAAVPDGGQGLASIRITATRGHFHLNGSAAPAPLVGGVPGRLAPNGLRITGDLTANGGRMPFVFRAASEAIIIDGRGILLEDARRLQNTKVLITLSDPSALLSTLRGRNMRLSADLSGSTLAPGGRYAFAADWASLGDQRLVRPAASGAFGGAITGGDLSMKGRFNRLTGAGEFVEELSTGAEFSAILKLDGLRLTTDDLDMRTQQGRARAEVMLDLRDGRYDVRATTDVPRYPLPGFAVVAAKARLHLFPEPGQPRKMRITGPVSAQLTQLDNPLLSFLFGGLPSGTASIVRTPDGTIRFADATVRGPDMTLSGKGIYRLGQQIAFTAAGTQRRFGTVATELSGDIAQPAAEILVDEYRLGLPLRKIRGSFLPFDGGYEFSAAGETPLGPIETQGAVLSGDDTRYRFDLIDLAGIRAAGVLKPSGGVPVDGTLSLAGQGIDGTARFSGEGDVQNIDLNLLARRGMIDAQPQLHIGSGKVVADICIAPEGNRSNGEYDLQGVRLAGLSLSRARGTFHLNGEDGKVSAALTGRRGQPFNAQMDLGIDPAGFTLAANGQYGRDDFRLVQPARILADEGTYRLRETVLDLPRGSVTLSGALGREQAIRLSFEEAGLEPLSLFVPDLSFSGTVSGQAAYVRTAPGRAAAAEARLFVNDFSRTSGVLAKPIDIALIGQLSGSRAAMRAAFADNETKLGNFAASMTGIDVDAPAPLTALAGARVRGRLDFSGPAGAIWPLTGIESVALYGPVAADIRIGGLIGDPDLSGSVTSDGMRFESVASGTVVEDLSLEGRFSGSRLLLQTFSGRSQNGGKATGTGAIDLSFTRGFPLQISLRAEETDLVDIDTLSARVTGDLLVTNSRDRGGRIEGALNVDRARYRPGEAQLAAIPGLNVREVNREFARAEPPQPQTEDWTLAVKAAGNNRVTVRGAGLDSEWAVDFDLGGPVSEPKVTGTANLLRGDYDFAGRRFALTRGEIAFQGRYPPDPALDIDAEARVEGLTATIQIRGTASQPQIRFASIPSLPQDEILSRVLFGASLAELNPAEAVQLAGAVAALQSGGSSALDPIGNIRSAIGIDRLRIGGGSGPEGSGAGFAAGEYLGRRTYVEVATDTEGNTATQIEYALTRVFSILGRVSTFRGNSIGIRISNDY